MSDERHGDGPHAAPGGGQGVVKEPTARMAPVREPAPLSVDDLSLDDTGSGNVPVADAVSPEATDGRKTTKRRAKMTLRIPDDEIARPQTPSASPMAPPAAPVISSAPPRGLSQPPIQAQRIINIGEPASEPLDLRTIDPESTVKIDRWRDTPDLPPSPEDSWTPYQPTVADGPPIPKPLPAAGQPAAGVPAVLRDAPPPPKLDPKEPDPRFDALDRLERLDEGSVTRIQAAEPLAFEDGARPLPQVAQRSDPPPRARLRSAPPEAPRTDPPPAYRSDPPPAYRSDPPPAYRSDPPPAPDAARTDPPPPDVARTDPPGRPSDFSQLRDPTRTMLSPYELPQRPESDSVEVALDADLDDDKTLELRALPSTEALSLAADASEPAELSVEDLVSVDSEPAGRFPGTGTMPIPRARPASAPPREPPKPAPLAPADAPTNGLPRSPSYVAAQELLRDEPGPPPIRPRTASNPPPAVDAASRAPAVAKDGLPAMRPPSASQPVAQPTTPNPPKGEAKDAPPPMRARAISSPGVDPRANPAPTAAPSRPQASPQLLASAPAPVPLEITQPLSQTADAPKKKARGWWEELFNEDYLRASPDADSRPIQKEVDFIEDSLGVAQGATVLDLGCGTGRHAIELARRGYKVVGLDSSPVMLGRAQEAARRANVDVTFVQGDMREMLFEDAFDGVFSWDMSFGYFEEDKNAMVVALVRKALRKGGQFLLDVQNRDYVVHQSPSVAWFEGDRCICMDEMQVDFITSRMRIKRTMIMDDGRSREIEYSIRIYSLHELGRVLHEQGFRVAEVSGRLATPGVYFGNESPRTLILAEKR